MMEATTRSSSMIFFFFCFLSCLLVLSSSVKSSSSSNSNSEKVPVELYYESLCPYCADFIINHLSKVFKQEDLISIIHLKLVPWGNAKIRPNTTDFDCQHGPSECLLNTIEACAISAWPDVGKHFPFIYCVETLADELKYSKWKTCFRSLHLHPKHVTDCYTSGHGKELELEYAAQTGALKPPHDFVPWVVVDGLPLYEDYEDFIKYVCKAYTGSAVPKTCSELSLISIGRDKPDNFRPVCYAEGPEKATSSARARSVLRSWGQKIYS